MRTFIFLFVINCLVIAVNAEEAKLCHIANMGFYVTDGENGILLDALDQSEWMQSMGGLEKVRNRTFVAMDNLIS